MQDFDTARDARLQGERTFKIGGQVFEYKPAVPPEALIRWADMDNETPEAEAIQIIDQTVLAFLTPGQEQKWSSVRDVSIANPLTANDIIGVVRWLIEEQTGRPTTPSSASTNGQGTPTPGTTLTAVPGLPVAPASTV